MEAVNKLLFEHNQYAKTSMRADACGRIIAARSLGYWHVTDQKSSVNTLWGNYLRAETVVSETNFFYRATKSSNFCSAGLPGKFSTTLSFDFCLNIIPLNIFLFILLFTEVLFFFSSDIITKKKRMFLRSRSYIPICIIFT